MAQDEARPVILYVARQHDRNEGGDHRRGPLEPGERVEAGRYDRVRGCAEVGEAVQQPVGDAGRDCGDAA